jgi:hypothetical protein
VKGWIGKVFRDRYHSHVLKTFSEMQRAIEYVLRNAEKHIGLLGPDRKSSALWLQDENGDWFTVNAKGQTLKRAMSTWRMRAAGASRAAHKRQLT